MRYLAVLALVLGIGIPAAGPVALAQTITPGPNSTFINRYGNKVIGLEPGAGGAYVCYMDGVAYSCIQPAQLTLYTTPDPGIVAGPMPTVAPNHIPFYGGDRGN